MKKDSMEGCVKNKALIRVMVTLNKSYNSQGIDLLGVNGCHHVAMQSTKIRSQQTSFFLSLRD